MEVDKEMVPLTEFKGFFCGGKWVANEVNSVGELLLSKDASARGCGGC